MPSVKKSGILWLGIMGAAWSGMFFYHLAGNKIGWATFPLPAMFLIWAFQLWRNCNCQGDKPARPPIT